MMLLLAARGKLYGSPELQVVDHGLYLGMMLRKDELGRL